MEFTKQNIEKLNKQAIEAKDGLVESVTNYILDKFDEYDDPKQIVVDVVTHGCVSGIVGELIYYSDTTAYYAKNKDAINRLLYEQMEELGEYDLTEFFCGEVSWDPEDPLALDYYNQNILAWFGFETTMRNVALQFDELEELV